MGRREGAREPALVVPPPTNTDTVAGVPATGRTATGCGVVALVAAIAVMAQGLQHGVEFDP